MKNPNVRYKGPVGRTCHLTSALAPRPNYADREKSQDNLPSRLFSRLKQTQLLDYNKAKRNDLTDLSICVALSWSKALCFVFVLHLFVLARYLQLIITDVWVWFALWSKLIIFFLCEYNSVNNLCTNAIVRRTLYSTTTRVTHKQCFQTTNKMASGYLSKPHKERLMSSCFLHANYLRRWTNLNEAHIFVSRTLGHWKQCTSLQLKSTCNICIKSIQDLNIGKIHTSLLWLVKS